MSALSSTESGRGRSFWTGKDADHCDQRHMAALCLVAFPTPGCGTALMAAPPTQPFRAIPRNTTGSFTPSPPIRAASEFRSSGTIDLFPHQAVGAIRFRFSAPMTLVASWPYSVSIHNWTRSFRIWLQITQSGARLTCDDDRASRSRSGCGAPHRT